MSDEGLKKQGSGFPRLQSFESLSDPAVSLAAATDILTGERILLVLPTEEAAERVYGDICFYLGDSIGKEGAIFFAAEVSSPYSGASPDADDMSMRMKAALRLISEPENARVVIASARSLMKKLPPPEFFAAYTDTFRLGDALDREALTKKLVAVGYQSAPLAEYPGSFSLRGAIMDIFPPSFDNPFRIEVLGDEIDRILEYDAETQRSIKRLEAISIPPARAIVLDDSSRKIALSAINRLAEIEELEGKYLRRAVEEISESRRFFGIEALMPAFHETLGSVFDYAALANLSAIVVDPRQIAKTLMQSYRKEEEGYGRPFSRGEVAFPPEAHFFTPSEVISRLREIRKREYLPALPVGVEAHIYDKEEIEEEPDEELGVAFISRGAGWPIEAGVKIEEREIKPVVFLREEIKSAAQEDPLFPLIDLIERSREEKRPPVIVCSSQGQLERVRNLLGGRGIQTRLFEEGSSPLQIPRDSLWGAGTALFKGGLSGGAIDYGVKLTIIGESDIFGEKISRAAKPKPSRGAPELKELEEGDLIVHVDFGIGRYNGLTRLFTGGAESDFILIEYRDGDKLYLPVTSIDLLRRYRKLDGDLANVRLDKLGSTRWIKARAKVKEAVLKLAGELLEIYALRSEAIGVDFTVPQEEFGEFEARFPYSETEDQKRSIEEIIADMRERKPMDRLLVGDVGYGKTEVAMRAAFIAAWSGYQTAVLTPTTVLAMQHYSSFRQRFEGTPVSIGVISRFQSKREQAKIVAEAAEGKLDILIGTHRLLSDDIKFKKLGLMIVDEEHRFGVKHKEKIKKLKGDVDALTMTATPIPRTLHLAMIMLRDLSMITTPPPDRRAVKTFLLKRDDIAIEEIIRREVSRGGQVYFVHNRIKGLLKLQEQFVARMPDIRFTLAHGQMAEGKLEEAMIEFIEGDGDVLLCTDIIESGLDIPNANTIIIDEADMFGLAQLYQMRGRVGRSSRLAYCYMVIDDEKRLTPEAEMRINAILEHQALGSGFNIASQDLEIRGAGEILGAEQSGHVASVGFDLFTELLADTVERLKKGEVETTLERHPVEIKLPVPTMIPESYIPDIKERLSYYQRFSGADSEAKITELLGEMSEIYGRPPEETMNFVEISYMKRLARKLGLSHITYGGKTLLCKFAEKPPKEAEWLERFIYECAGSARITDGVLRITAEDDPAILLTASKLLSRLEAVRDKYPEAQK